MFRYRRLAEYDPFDRRNLFWADGTVAQGLDRGVWLGRLADLSFPTGRRADPQRVGGDMTFGRGPLDWLVDNPTAVAQAVLTRLKLWQGEWFLNLDEGTPWMQQILGHAARGGVPDAAIKGRILSTPYVTQVTDYASSYEPTDRSFVVSCQVYTAFGLVTNAPPGALISPTGQLVMPLARPASTARLEAPPHWQQDPQPPPQLPVQRYLPPLGGSRG